MILPNASRKYVQVEKNNEFTEINGNKSTELKSYSIAIIRIVNLVFLIVINQRPRLIIIIVDKISISIRLLVHLTNSDETVLMKAVQIIAIFIANQIIIQNGIDFCC